MAAEGLKYVLVGGDAGASGIDDSLLVIARSDPRFKLSGIYPMPSGAGSQVRNVYLFENVAAPIADANLDSTVTVALR